MKKILMMMLICLTMMFTLNYSSKAETTNTAEEQGYLNLYDPNSPYLEKITEDTILNGKVLVFNLDFIQREIINSEFADLSIGIMNGTTRIAYLYMYFADEGNGTLPYFRMTLYFDIFDPIYYFNFCDVGSVLTNSEGAYNGWSYNMFNISDDPVSIYKLDMHENPVETTGLTVRYYDTKTADSPFPGELCFSIENTEGGTYDYKISDIMLITKEPGPLKVQQLATNVPDTPTEEAGIFEGMTTLEIIISCLLIGFLGITVLRMLAGRK